MTPWLFPVLALCPVVVLVVARRAAGPPGFALADAPALAPAGRRTAAVAAGLTLCACLLLAVAASLVRESGSALAALVPQGQSTVVVLDMSASVSPLVFDEIAKTLILVSETSDDSVRVGLVLFSDVAQVALPPGTRTSELKPFIRFFLPKTEPFARERPDYYRYVSGGGGTPSEIRYIDSPWAGTFGAGTAISTGLATARETLQGSAESGGHVLLISDLDNQARDGPELTRELLTYARQGISLDVIAVPPAIPAQREVFERVLVDGSVVDSSSLRAANDSLAPMGPGVPIAFIAVVGFLALLLAVREPAASVIDLSRTREGPQR